MLAGRNLYPVTHVFYIDVVVADGIGTVIRVAVTTLGAIAVHIVVAGGRDDHIFQFDFCCTGFITEILVTTFAIPIFDVARLCTRGFFPLEIFKVNVSSI